jgi:hypothetical protein
MGLIKKITIAPVYLEMEPDIDGFEGSLPYTIGQGIKLVDVNQYIQNADFSWASDALSKNRLDRFKQKWRYGLLHEYEAEEWSQSMPEAESQRLIHRAFLGLRMIRPTPKGYEYLQAQVRDVKKVEPFHFSDVEEQIFAPIIDTVNRIRIQDAVALTHILPNLLQVNESTCLPVHLAIENLEVGYISDFVHVKQLLWVTALDGLFTSDEWEHRGTWVATERIKHFVDPNTLIYVGVPQYLTPPNITVGAVISDIYEARNAFAHGKWMPKKFLQKPGYGGARGKHLTYADVLLEATSLILRTVIVKILKDDLLEFFADKQRVNDHFSKLGFVRKKKTASSRQAWV